MGLAYVVVVSLTSLAVGSGEQAGSTRREMMITDHTSGSSTYLTKDSRNSFEKESIARPRRQWHSRHMLRRFGISLTARHAVVVVVVPAFSVSVRAQAVRCACLGWHGLACIIREARPVPTLDGARVGQWWSLLGYFLADKTPAGTGSTRMMNLGRSEEAWSIVGDDMAALLLCPRSLVLPTHFDTCCTNLLRAHPIRPAASSR
jgi:hypothetical protein